MTNQEVVEANKKQEPVRGVRGEVGVCSTRLHLRQMWHDAYFKRVSVKTLTNNPDNENKQVFIANAGAPSLKRFARDLVAKGDAAAKEWFANKAGAKNEKRSDVNIALARACAIATKTERRKAKSA